MPLDVPLAPVADRVEELNHRHRHHGALALLSRALSDQKVGRIALVSSFGAESVALLHLISIIDRATPVLFIDTEMLFAETRDYQVRLAEELGLTDLRTVRASRTKLGRHDPDGRLHRRDPDACCRLRKTEPLSHALAPFDAWITGRKRYQGGDRADLDLFENEADARIKVNPLARWTTRDVQDYITNNRLPRHPLVAWGYPSIGCRPCTTPVAPGEDARAGRWRTRQKVECGIHFENGRAVARHPPTGDPA